MITFLSTTDLTALLPVIVDHVTFPRPVGLAAGDVMILVAASQVAGAPTVTTSGWITVRSYQGDDGDNVLIAATTATGTEPSSMTVSFSQDMNSNEAFACLLVYRGARLPQPGDVAALNVGAPSGIPTDTFHCPSRTPEQVSDVYIGIAHDIDAEIAFVTVPGNQRYNFDANDGALCVFDLPVSSTAPTGSKTCVLASPSLGSAFSFMLHDASAAMVQATNPPDYIALAISRLPHMYRSGKGGEPTNTEKAIRAHLSPATQLAQAMWDVRYMRTIDNAVGAQLDVLGAWVGRARQGVTDDEIYRRYIRAQILTNKSDGVIGDILAVARAVIGDAGTIVNSNTGTAAYVLRVDGLAVADNVAAVLVELVLQATSDGVRAVVQYSSLAPEQVFRFDVGPGLDVGHLATSLDEVS